MRAQGGSLAVLMHTSLARQRTRTASICTPQFFDVEASTERIRRINVSGVTAVKYPSSFTNYGVKPGRPARIILAHEERLKLWQDDEEIAFSSGKLEVELNLIDSKLTENVLVQHT